jgi:hypothetical protein
MTEDSWFLFQVGQKRSL